METKLLEINEVCASLRISRMTFYKEYEKGAFVCIKIGSRRLVDAASVETFIAQKKKEGAPRDPRIDKMLAGRAAKRIQRKARTRVEKRT